MLVKIIPDMYDIMIGNVKMNHVYGAVLIEIDQELMPKSERILKRLFDLAVSSVLFILCIPIYIVLTILVKLSSEGPLFFAQERIGKGGKPFNIYKFRSRNFCMKVPRHSLNNNQVLEPTISFCGESWDAMDVDHSSPFA